MTKDSLMQLSRTTDSTATVCEREVVEHEQLTRLQGHFDLDSFDLEFVTCEEFELRAHALELRAAKEVRIGFDARQKWCGASRGLDEAGQASLDVAQFVVPSAVCPPVGNESTNELRRGRPRALPK